MTQEYVNSQPERFKNHVENVVIVGVSTSGCNSNLIDKL